MYSLLNGVGDTLCPGDVGFADLRREITPQLDGIPETDWVLAARLHGKRYATEAVLAALAQGDATRRSRIPRASA